MEILHLGKYYWPERGGIETATKNLAEIGVDLGHDVSCVVSGSSRGRTVRERVGEVAVTRQSRWLKLLSAPISPELLGLRFHGARVLHLHLPHPMAELAVTKFLARGNSSNTRLIPFLHATPLSQGRLGRLWFSSITARILDRSESILVSNENLVAAFPELRRWKDRFRVVPFFTDVWTDEHFAKAMTMRNVSRDVLSIGRLVPYKGFDVLVRAWARARIDCAAFRAFRLSIVGSGPEEGDLRRQIEALDLGECITLVGPVDETEKERLLSRSMLFVAPSVTEAETFGISILEAFARGLPVITTQLRTGVRLLSRDGACGAAVPPGSVDRLSDSLVALTSLAPAELSRIGKVNLDFAREHYSRSRCIADYGDLLVRTREDL